MSGLTEDQQYTKTTFAEFTEKLLKMITMLDDANLNISNITGTIDVFGRVQWCDLDELMELGQFTYKIETTDGIVISYEICDYVEPSVFFAGKTNSISYNIYKSRHVKLNKYFYVELSPKPPL